MKIDQLKTRTPAEPLAGVRLSTVESKQAVHLAARLVAELPAGDLAVLGRALAHETVRLEAAGAWTPAGTDMEFERIDQHHRALHLLAAVEAARAGARIQAVAAATR